MNPTFSSVALPRNQKGSHLTLGAIRIHRSCCNLAGWLGRLRGEYVEPKEPAGAVDAWQGEFHLTAFRTLGTLRTMSASRRRPLPHFQSGMAAM